ncbi:LIM domain-binding protein 2, partial [Xenoophorus captivus]
MKSIHIQAVCSLQACTALLFVHKLPLSSQHHFIVWASSVFSISILSSLFPAAIGRTLIPRYFSTVFEGGVTELHYILKHSKESFHNSCITLDCDQCTMVTQHGKPMFTKVCTEGRLILEFAFDDLMRIKTWHFTIRQYRELIPRSILAMHV